MPIRRSSSIRPSLRPTTPLRSALSLLSGDLVLNLEASLAPRSLVVALEEAGYSTLLATDSSALADRVGASFGAQLVEADAAQLPGPVGEKWADLGVARPRFVLVHLAQAGRPLHGDSTDADALRHRYREVVARLSGLLSRVAQVTRSEARPQLLVLFGASGMELGEHPADPLRPYDPHLRVPFFIGLRAGRGLPAGSYPQLVGDIDVRPTLFDFLDLRSDRERAVEQERRLGRSLEGLVHGWVPNLGPRRLFFAGPGHAGVRTEDWKLMTEIALPWAVRRASTSLYSLREDPGERHDLGRGRALGPVGTQLLGDLQGVLERPRPPSQRAEQVR